tara:strand:- start:605 stop:796 length:192 start_codon:yes stop_codon:yes gene_type:complete
LSKSSKIIYNNDSAYIVLGTVSVSSDFSPDELKKSWSLADTVLRNGDTYYICMKAIEAEFEEI